MNLTIGSVNKRSTLALQRKLARNQQSELIDFNLKFFEKIKNNENNQDVFVLKNKIKVNAVAGFSRFKFKGEAHNQQKQLEKNTKKFLIHSSSIVGETNGGKSWLIEVPFNQGLCLIISKKFIPKIKTMTIEEITSSKTSEILEVFWHLNHTIKFYQVNGDGYNYLGKQKLQDVSIFLKAIHLLAITGLKWSYQKVSVVKFFQNNTINNLENDDDPDGNQLLTIDDILAQLLKNRNQNYQAIKWKELKNQNKLDQKLRTSRVLGVNDFNKINVWQNNHSPLTNDHYHTMDEEIDQETLRNYLEAWTKN